MPLQSLSACELASAPTLFESFMGSGGCGHKTVAELLTIYRERRSTLDEDVDDDLRVERFIGDMSAQRWRSDVVVRIGEFGDTTLVVDGIHRGIAYLACAQDGVEPNRLPPLRVER